MAELAQIDQYRGSEPEMIIVPVEQTGSILPDHQFPLYQTSGNSVWRLRYANVSVVAGGTVGTTTVTLGCYVSGLAPDMWQGSGSLINAVSPLEITAQGNFCYSWSTEIGDSYQGRGIDFGTAEMMGIPLVWMPALTDIVISISKFAGSDRAVQILNGTLQLEKWPLDVLSGGGQSTLGNVYLLPQTI